MELRRAGIGVVDEDMPHGDPPTGAGLSQNGKDIQDGATYTSRHNGARSR